MEKQNSQTERTSHIKVSKSDQAAAFDQNGQPGAGGSDSRREFSHYYQKTGVKSRYQCYYGYIVRSYAD